MKNTKPTFKKIIGALICFVMIITTACTQPVNEPPVDSENLIPAEKIVGSKSIMESRWGFSTIEEKVQFTIEATNLYRQVEVDEILSAGRIVIGRIDSVEDVRKEYWREKTDENDDPPWSMVTFYKIIVEKTLFGDEIDTLLLCLEGTPDSHAGMTKPDVGDNFVLFLIENADGASFATISYEESLFKINEDGTLYSFSDAEFTAQFDGKPLSVLEDIISKVIREVSEQSI